MGTTANSKMTFEEFDRLTKGRKTGCYGYGVEMYTRRTGDRSRAFQIKWYERNGKYPTHRHWKRALAKARSGWMPQGGLGSEWVEKRRTFPYTPEGLAEAVAFSEEIQPMREEFWNREDD